MTELERAAILFDQARREAVRIKFERGACLCELAERAEPETNWDGTDPCWKNWQDGPEDRTLAAESEWCDTCRRRQRLHEQYRVAMKIRGARMRQFFRLALKAWELDRQVAEVKAQAVA